MSAACPLARVRLQPPRTRRVLVVDDDQLACRMLADAFARRGVETATAPDGETALRRIIDELHTLDLVVTDLLMPGVGGEELVYRVRQLGGEHDLAIVVVSAHLTPDVRGRLDGMGADAVLAKAAGPDTVAAVALAALEERRAQLGPGERPALAVTARRGPRSRG